MKRTLLLAILLITITTAFGQPYYKQALGLKFPGGTSVTYKNFVSGTRALEAQATFWNNGVRFSGLYELNFFTFEGVEGLGWFVGPGAHIGFYKDEYVNAKGLKAKADIGIDGIIGIEYKLKDIPLNFSLDWQPSIVLAESTGFSPTLGGFAVRYTF